MKKILAILMLTIFMLSAVPASAFEGKTGWGIKNIDRQSIEKHNNIKNRYNNAANEWNGLSNDFKAVKDKIKRYGDLDPENQEMVLERTRSFLDKTIERMELHLDIMESWVERIQISEGRKELILEDIEEKRSQLEEYKLQIDSSEDLESLRELAKEIKDSWHNFKPTAKHISGELLTAKIGNIVEDSENLAISLQEKLNNLDSGDEKVIEMQELLDEFNLKVILAKEQYDLAQEAYSNIDSVSDADNLFQETKEFVFAAKDYLREAHQILRELVKEYRDFTGVVPEQESDDDDNGDKYPEVQDESEE
jgi:hypothetical protein